ncbi:PE-PPE domain-containing protein [Hyalangium sp.]|uniref:PE-PPE domain-containing protein n=1 Tax=Hyalangium sp. TaxID=2028555 RepID=UPI002D3678BF|nr:PE-PPE domain-containing protein [Hyalangium sp.]HYH99204.1 PE-PPE domain-containing protein [Hyalangium sp.]
MGLNLQKHNPLKVSQPQPPPPPQPVPAPPASQVPPAPQAKSSSPVVDGFDASPVSTARAASPAAAPAEVAAQAATAPGDDFATRRAQHALLVDRSKPAKTYDGMYIGADGYAYPPDKFKASEVPPFKPNPPVAQPAPTQYYVNGILTEATDDRPRGADGSFQNNEVSIQADGEAQKIANATGTNVVLIYNATEGEAADFVQATNDVLLTEGSSNPAADTLANAIYEDVKAGRQVSVTGYSQGAAITARALHQVRDRLYNDTGGVLGHLPVVGDENRRALDRMMGQIKVTTFAGAGANFPDGPSYDHYVNSKDPVPNFAGLGGLNGFFGHAGRGARVHEFEDAGAPGADLLSPDGVHGLQHYLAEHARVQDWNHTVSSAPPDLQAVIAKADSRRVKELSQELGLSSAQIHDLARTHPFLFTRHEGNGLIMRSFVDMAQTFGLKGDSAAGLFKAITEGTEDPSYALSLLLNNVQSLQPQPKRQEDWLRALGEHAVRSGAPEDYQRAFANAEKYLSGRVPGSYT